jgi:LPS O-antigen subunit length determinant protein (WzzB/FepE family)
MMEWALIILFAAAVLLFILSFIKKDSVKVDSQLEQIASTFGDEMNVLQEKIRNIEIDAEITVQEAGILAMSSEKRNLLREVLDLHKRGYSFESIALKTKQSEEEIERMLTPYMKTTNERRNVANDI